MSSLRFVNFNIQNYNDVEVLTGYALPINTFTFIPDLVTSDNSISTKKVLWNFGDGTTSSDITATHSYVYPGEYRVILYAYGSRGESYISTLAPTITVFDFVHNSLEFAEVSGVELNVKAGHKQLITIHRQNSWQTYNTLSAIGYTVNLYASGCTAPIVDLNEYNSNAWSHLDLYSSFFKQNTIDNGVEYVPITSIQTTDIELYARLVDGEYELCEVTDEDSFFIGTSGTAEVYFSSDAPKNISSVETPIIIFGSLDTKQFDDRLTKSLSYYPYQSAIPGYINTAQTVIPVLKVRYTLPTALSFSTNGLDTEADAVLSTFEIPPISWAYTKIPFIVKLKDAENYSTKFYPLLSANVQNLTASSAISFATFSLVASSGSSFTPVSSVSFYADFLDEASPTFGGYFKGYFISPTSATNVKLSATVVVANSAFYNVDTSSTVASSLSTLTGASNLFNIYTEQGLYGIAKENENFDFKKYLMRFTGTDTFGDKVNFFESFLPTIVGKSDSKPYELGKTIYEKIANFTNNNNDIDKANVQALISLCKQQGIHIEDVNYTYPGQLKRLIDLLSIKQRKLFGSVNQYIFDFTDPSGTSSPSFAVNLGDPVTLTTDSFVVSSYLVAHELFSNQFILVKTAELSGYSLSSTMPFSAFNNNEWGWNLALPDGVSGIDISAYYNIYRFVDSQNKNVVDSVINWNDSTTTLSFYNSSFFDWSKQDGIMDNIINYEMTKGLRLILSSVNIVYNN